jgi:anti-sigma B factor antagonist
LEVVIEAKSPETAVVLLAGRLDLMTCGQLKEQLATCVQDGHRHLVLDLQRVSFMDSSGLGALIGGLKTARLAGGDIRIARPGEQPAMILELTNLNRVLVTYPDVEEALAGF